MLVLGGLQRSTNHWCKLLPTPDMDIVQQDTILCDMDVVEDNSIPTPILDTNSFYKSKRTKLSCSSSSIKPQPGTSSIKRSMCVMKKMFGEEISLYVM